MSTRNENHKLIHTMAEVAVFAALGFILDLIASAIPNPLFANGGSFGIALAAVFFIAFRRGVLPGVFCGLIIGLLQLIGGVYTSSLANTPWKLFAQIALDYWLAYPVAGLAGLFSPLYQKAQTKGMKTLWLSLGCFVGGLMKFLSHFLAGIFFWPSSTWSIGDTNIEIAGGPAVYSLVYNGAYMLPDTIVSALIVIIIALRIPSSLDPDHALLSVKKNDGKEVKEDK